MRNLRAASRCLSSGDTRGEPRTWFIECDVAIVADTSEKQLDAAVRQDALFVPEAS